MGKTAVIIGAGPAGLTAAYELLQKTDICPVVIESDTIVGGISRTVNHNGNRIDIGGHRFFSKSDQIMDWWKRILPIQQQSTAHPEEEVQITYRRKSRCVSTGADVDPASTDDVMLIRPRVSRIFFRGQFFNYPISLSLDTVRKLGFGPMLKIIASYLYARAFPQRPEQSLANFFRNRFGDELYRTFFKDYTEKVWGVACNELPADWGAQRVKGLSIAAVVKHALSSVFRRDRTLGQKDTETSLIEQFLYPKLGPGQLWERVARLVRDGGGQLHLGCRAVQLHRKGSRIVGVTVAENETGVLRKLDADFVFSTMPVQDLVNAVRPEAPRDVQAVANGLVYRDFITVGLLLRRLRVGGGVDGRELSRVLPDNWIYIQEKDIRAGRLQVFNNWSPYMVADPETIWLGVEYFCTEGDDLWSRNDDQLVELAIKELSSMGLLAAEDVLDHTVLRVPKSYPAYLGTYDQLDTVKQYTDQVDNLFLVGRNGMHKYNNQDHSMLAAMTAVENIVNSRVCKKNVWAVNTEETYHEEKDAAVSAPKPKKPAEGRDGGVPGVVVARIGVWLERGFGSLLSVADRRFNVLMLCFALASLGLGLLVVPWGEPFTKDALRYMQKGMEVAAGNWTPIDDHSIGWSIVSGGVFAALGIESQQLATMVSRVLSVGLVAACVLPFGLLCRQALPAKTAIVAIAVFAMFPPLLTLGALGLSEPLFIFLVLWMAYFAVRAEERPTLVLWAAGLAGLAYFVRPTGIVLVGVLLVVILPLLVKRKMHWRYLFLVPLAFVLVSLPNLYLRYDAFGSAFYYGNNSRLFVDNYDSVWNDATPAPGLFEYIQSHSFFDLVDRFLVNGLGRMSVDFYQVLGNFWFFMFVLACPFVLFGLRKRFKEYVLLVCLFLPLLSLVPVYAIFHNDRHMLIAIPFATLLACRFLVALFENAPKRNLLTVGLLALVVTQTVFSVGVGRVESAVLEKSLSFSATVP